jgi:hypothetical protein
VQIEAKPTWHHFGGKINWFGPTKEKRLPRRAHDLENQDASKLLEFNSRIQFASNESKLVPRNLNLGPHLKVGLRVVTFLAQKDFFAKKGSRTQKKTYIETRGVSSHCAALPFYIKKYLNAKEEL